MRFTPRPEYRDLRAYDAEPAAQAINLADNTPAYGMSPGVVEALHTLAEGAAPDAAGTPALAVDLTRYPTTYSRPLREAIARYVGVSPDEIMVGAGSDETLSCTFRALASPGQRLAYMHPTFVMTPIFARTNSVVPAPVPLTPSHDVDVDALLAERADLTYLCTPNNPTGVPIAPAVVERVAREARGLVMVDEAYAEFAGTNWAGEAPATDGLLVYRTFSKAFGLAGARVGFVVGARSLVAELEKARGPYTVSSISERLALAALEGAVPWMRERVADVVEVREEFIEQLRADGWAPLPSAANFVLVPVRDAAAAHMALRARGILVRAFAALPGIGDALRITIGARAVMATVREGLQQCAPA